MTICAGGNISQVYTSLDEGNTPNLDKAITRGRRNLVRLMSLQEKITDILNYRFTEGSRAGRKIACIRERNITRLCSSD